LGIFDFKAFINVGMLLVESEEARVFKAINTEYCDRCN